VTERPRQTVLCILLPANTLVPGRGEAQKERLLMDRRIPCPSFCIPKKKRSCCKAEKEITTALKYFGGKKRPGAGKRGEGGPGAAGRSELGSPV